MNKKIYTRGSSNKPSKVAMVNFLALLSGLEDVIFTQDTTKNATMFAEVKTNLSRKVEFAKTQTWAQKHKLIYNGCGKIGHNIRDCTRVTAKSKKATMDTKKRGFDVSMSAKNKD